MSRGTAFRAKLHVRPAKSTISLRSLIRASRSSEGTLWLTKDSKRPQADSEDSDQTARTRRLN